MLPLMWLRIQTQTVQPESGVTSQNVTFVDSRVPPMRPRWKRCQKKVLNCHKLHVSQFKRWFFNIKKNAEIHDIVFFTNKSLLEQIYSCFADFWYDSINFVVIYVVRDKRGSFTRKRYWYVTQTDNHPDQQIHNIVQVFFVLKKIHQLTLERFQECDWWVTPTCCLVVSLHLSTAKTSADK